MEDSKRAKFLCWAFIILAFLSKVSFDFTGLVPRQLGFLIFQGGIHPYLNVFLNFTLAFLFLMTARRNPATWEKLWSLKEFHGSFRFFSLACIGILLIQTILQILWGSPINVFLMAATLSSTFLLITMFGLVIPRFIPLSDFIDGVADLCFIICLTSILFYLAGFSSLYKGNRFIGILKHIPFMVTCSSLGFLFHLYRAKKCVNFRSSVFFIFQLTVFFTGIFLTGTRSALGAALGGILTFFILYKSKNANFRLVRLLTVWILILSATLFGSYAYNFTKAVITGELAIGQRNAQDGIGDRVDEVYRGLDLLETSPHIGLGLLSKFSSAEDEDVVDNYNSFQDPHNLFISSAVVAGWPFALLVIFGFVMLTIGAITAIWTRNLPQLTLGIYLASHLPILFIYHMHLSLGGLADRLYWMCFGYISLKCFQKDSEKNIKTKH